MRLSQTFIKTLHEAPKGETAKNGALLTRAGYIHKEMAGVYDYLPLGLKVLENIKNIIREELNKLGCEEVLMSALQNPEPWEKTGRFSDQEVDIWFKTELSAGGELGLAPTHEEPIIELVKKYIKSYKDLPLSVYQFQNGESANFYEGEFPSTKLHGAAVVFKLRDKTAILQTDAQIFREDFMKLLSTVTYNQ